MCLHTLHTILNVWPLHMQIGKPVINEKTKITMPFSKLHIWLKVLTTYVYKLVIYATTQLAKYTHLQVIPQQLSFSNIREKPLIFLVTTHRDRTFAPAETLFIQIPLQQFLFLGLYKRTENKFTVLPFLYSL